MHLKLAAATEDLHSDLKRAIGLASELEITGVRLNTRTEIDVQNVTQSGLRQTLLFVKERRLQVAGLLCPTRHALYDEEFLEPRLEVIRRSMDLARSLETKELLVRTGRIPDPDEVAAAEPTVPADDAGSPFFRPSTSAGPSGAQQAALLVELLNDLAEYGNHVGCVLTVIVPEFNVSRLRQLKSAVTKGPIQFCFDPATCLMTGADPVTVFRELHADVGYVRARDAQKDVDGAGVETAVGRGNVDWVQLLPTLIEADFTNWVSVERAGGDQRRAEVTSGTAHLRSMLPAT